MVGNSRAVGHVPIVVLVLAASAFLAFNPSLFNDGDTGWHLATGELILSTGEIPHRDPFSFTRHGAAWTAHEWLADVAMAVAFRLGGWSALALLFALTAGAALLLIGRSLAAALPMRWALAVLALLAAVLAPVALARPHLLAWPLLAGWTLILLRSRQRRRSPPLWAAALMLLWANLHASYIVGLGLVGLFAMEAFVEERRAAPLGRWTVFGLLSLAAALLTPHGLQGLLYPFQVSGMRILPLISEWRPTSLPGDLLFVAFAAGLSLLAVWRWREVGPVRLALLAGLGWMAMEHSRHQALFAILGALVIIPRALPGQIGVKTAPHADRGTMAFLLGGLVLLLLARLSVPYQRADSATYPVTALGALPPQLKAQPVLNSYSFGGPLILHGIRPFIDGRSDMYGDDFTMFHQRLMDGDMAALDAAERRFGLGWTILQPGTPLIAGLDRHPGWRRAYADGSAVVHVKRA
jgi:hypothetical protein